MILGASQEAVNRSDLMMRYTVKQSDPVSIAWKRQPLIIKVSSMQQVHLPFHLMPIRSENRIEAKK